MQKKLISIREYLKEVICKEVPVRKFIIKTAVRAVISRVKQHNYYKSVATEYCCEPASSQHEKRLWKLCTDINH